MHTSTAIVVLTVLVAALGLRLAWNALGLPEITLPMVARSLACLAVFLAYALAGTLLPHLLGAHHHDARLGLAATLFAGFWVGMGTLWLMRHGPKLGEPPGWVAHFGWADIALLTGIVVPGAYMLARVLP